MANFFDRMLHTVGLAREVELLRLIDSNVRIARDYYREKRQRENLQLALKKLRQQLESIRAGSQSPRIGSPVGDSPPSESQRPNEETP